MSESFWKKEISLRRKPKAAAEPESPKGSLWTKEIDVIPGESFWKKEISLRRKPQPAAAVEPEPDAEAELARLEAAVEKTFSAAFIPHLDPGPPPEPVAEPEPEPWLTVPELPPAAETEVDAVPASVPAVPFWKKELSFKRAPKAPKPAKEQKAPRAAKAPKEPKPKREQRRPSLPRPSLSLPKRAPAGAHPVKRMVGLKIGASQLAAARVTNNGVAELLQLARTPLEQGVVVGGEVRDPEALATALRSFFARNKLPRKGVRLGIASNRIGVRIFDIEGIDDPKQLDNAIRFRAHEALPVPLDEAVLDYHVLDESVDADGNPVRRVLLVVAYRELIDRYVSACRKAGIAVAGVDLEAFALLRSLQPPRPDHVPSSSALVAVSIGYDRSTFAVSDGVVCSFTRVIEWGGSSLNVAIARAVDLAPSEVEDLKRAIALDAPEAPPGIGSETYALAVDAVRKQVQTFARELVASLQFYQHQPGSLGIGEVVITGGTAGMRGLAAELEQLIGARVRVGDPLARLKVAKKVAVDDQLGSLAVAIGLGIED